MSPLDKVRQALKQQIANEDVSKESPSHNAFEVEDIRTHENFSFVLKDNIVLLYDTSRGHENKCLQCFGPEKFPFGNENSQEYYTMMYRKAMQGVDDIMFIGYVNEKTFIPLETE